MAVPSVRCLPVFHLGSDLIWSDFVFVSGRGVEEEKEEEGWGLQMDGWMDGWINR
jgi:hypothetical protein